MRRHAFLLRTVALALAVAFSDAAPGAQASRPKEHGGESANRLTLDEALKILDVGAKTATMFNICVGIAVVDPRADLIAATRMTCGGSVAGGIGKAVTAALLGQRSADVSQFATDATTQDLNEATGRRMNFLQGGIPIFRNGALIGAVGVSGGGSSQYDEEIGVAGIKAIF
jgi:glc operon protein GlcG